MRLRLIVCLLVAALAACWLPTLAARAAVVLLKDSSEPVWGYLVRREEDRVVLRELLPQGGTRDREILKADIDELIVTVEPQRLEQLKPQQPLDYLEYAEELAEKRRDPEARDTALRLYVIAAWLAPDELGRSALLGMTALAGSPEEQHAYRALAFQLGGYKDPRLLRDDGDVAGRGRADALVPPGSPAAPAGRTARDGDPDNLLECIRHLRRGNRSVARRLAERKDVHAEFSRLQGLLTYDEFLAACLDTAPSESLLKALIQAELVLSKADARTPAPAADKSRSATPNWRATFGQPLPAPLPTLSLERVTPYDPRENVFRAGKWVAPDNK